MHCLSSCLRGTNIPADLAVILASKTRKPGTNEDKGTQERRGNQNGAAQRQRSLPDALFRLSEILMHTEQNDSELGKCGDQSQYQDYYERHERIHAGREDANEAFLQLRKLLRVCRQNCDGEKDDIGSFAIRFGGLKKPAIDEDDDGEKERSDQDEGGGDAGHVRRGDEAKIGAGGTRFGRRKGGGEEGEAVHT
ncbi:hypothetical protein FGB62_190g019 [Gracilaria domingensis]|nr:hypothetical protein FGB62_190g019 [Gracilaria domingensis]